MNKPGTNPKLDKLRALIKVANEDFATHDDVSQVFRTIVSHIAKLTKTYHSLVSSKIDEKLPEALAPHIKKHNTEIDERLTAFEGNQSERIADAVKPTADRVMTLEIGYDALSRETASIKQSIPKPTDLSGVHERISALENAPQAEPTATETAESIRNKLETLSNTASALKPEAIFGLRDELDRLQRQINAKSVGSTIAYSRGQIKLYDLTPFLNGSTTTFQLPAFWRVLTVQSSSTPNAFQPNVDYTVDGSAMTITFTNQINPAATLANGQTLTVLYAEP